MVLMFLDTIELALMPIDMIIIPIELDNHYIIAVITIITILLIDQAITDHITRVIGMGIDKDLKIIV